MFVFTNFTFFNLRILESVRIFQLKCKDVIVWIYQLLSIIITIFGHFQSQTLQFLYVLELECKVPKETGIPVSSVLELS